MDNNNKRLPELCVIHNSEKPTLELSRAHLIKKYKGFGSFLFIIAFSLGLPVALILPIPFIFVESIPIVPILCIPVGLCIFVFCLAAGIKKKKQTEIFINVVNHSYPAVKFDTCVKIGNSNENSKLAYDMNDITNYEYAVFENMGKYKIDGGTGELKEGKRVCLAVYELHGFKTYTQCFVDNGFSFDELTRFTNNKFNYNQQ